MRTALLFLRCAVVRVEPRASILVASIELASHLALLISLSVIFEELAIVEAGLQRVALISLPGSAFQQTFDLLIPSRRNLDGVLFNILARQNMFLLNDLEALCID